MKYKRKTLLFSINREEYELIYSSFDELKNYICEMIETVKTIGNIYFSVCLSGEVKSNIKNCKDNSGSLIKKVLNENKFENIRSLYIYVVSDDKEEKNISNRNDISFYIENYSEECRISFIKKHKSLIMK